MACLLLNKNKIKKCAHNLCAALCYYCPPLRSQISADSYNYSCYRHWCVHLFFYLAVEVPYLIYFEYYITVCNVLCIHTRRMAIQLKTRIQAPYLQNKRKASPMNVYLVFSYLRINCPVVTTPASAA